MQVLNIYLEHGVWYVYLQGSNEKHNSTGISLSHCKSSLIKHEECMHSRATNCYNAAAICIQVYASMMIDSDDWWMITESYL